MYREQRSSGGGGVGEAKDSGPGQPGDSGVEAMLDDFEKVRGGVRRRRRLPPALLTRPKFVLQRDTREKPSRKASGAKRKSTRAKANDRPGRICGFEPPYSEEQVRSWISQVGRCPEAVGRAQIDQPPFSLFHGTALPMDEVVHLRVAMRPDAPASSTPAVHPRRLSCSPLVRWAHGAGRRPLKPTNPSTAKWSAPPPPSLRRLVISRDARGRRRELVPFLRPLHPPPPPPPPATPRLVLRRGLDPSLRARCSSSGWRSRSTWRRTWMSCSTW
jgi:hypothetical protein